MNVYDLPQYDEPFTTSVILDKIIEEGDMGDGWLGWSVRSHENPWKRYPVRINIHTGECSCACADFSYRRRKFWPTIMDGCKHVESIIVAAYESNAD